MPLALRRMLVVVFTAVAVMSLSGYLLKAQCIGHYNAIRDSHLCSNDIQVLYDARGMRQHPFPYVHGDLVDRHLVGGSLEYPVLTGLFAWLPALVVDNDGSYLQVTALLLLPFTFIAAWLLTKMVRWRALIYALAPALIWYSFHNWDLLVVCATVAACYAWWRQRYGWAGAFLAIGADLKFWPIFLIVPLLLDRLSAKDRDGAVRSVASFAALIIGVNGPFLLASPRGWFAAYAFQADRSADITSNSIWYWGFPQLVTGDLNVIVPVLVILGTAVASVVGWRRARHDGAFPFIQVSAAILAVFLLTNKAHSPQYALWLLPFFCLLRLRWGWWVGYLAFDTILYVGLFRWYYDLSQGRDFGLAKQAVIIGVWGRIVMLALLFVVFLRAESAVESGGADGLSGQRGRRREGDVACGELAG